jgi:hypothetical protein
MLPVDGCASSAGLDALLLLLQRRKLGWKVQVRHEQTFLMRDRCKSCDEGHSIMVLVRRTCDGAENSNLRC